MPPKRSKKAMATSAKAKAKATSAPTTDSMDALYFRHYVDQVAKHGALTAILLQVGKFFEMYDSVEVATGRSRANVQQIAEICGSCVEPKQTADPARRRLFWGFPEMSLAKFERLLVAAGYTVVVIVQNKDATGDVTSRTVDHIASPGTLWDAEGGLAVRRSEQVLLGVYAEPYEHSARKQPHWYLATTAFDVMTGRCVSTEADITVIDGKPVLDAVQPFWSVYPPAEVVFWWCSATPPPSENAVAAMFPSTAGGRRIPIHIRVRDPKEDGAKAAATLRTDFLTAIYKPTASLTIQEYLGIGMYPFMPRSLANLLEFVRDHNPSYLAALHDHQVWTPEENVLLGNSALEQLALIPANSDKFSESLLYWLQRALTAMGRRALRERLLKPIADLEELNGRQDRIAALRTPAARAALEPHLRGMFDLPRLFRRFQLGSGGTDELLQVLTTYEKATRLFTAARGTVYEPQDAADLLKHCGSLAKIWCVERLRAARQQVGDTVAVGSVHPWCRGVHADLDALEDKWKALESQMLAVRTEWETLLEETDAITWVLKDDAPFTFTTTQRRATMLATAAKRRGLAEITLVKRGTSSVVTLETAATVAASAAALKVRAEWRAEVERYWRDDWSAWMAEAIEEGLLEAQVDAIAQLDAECALATVSEEYGYVRPLYLESTEGAPAGFRVCGLRHPIIERVNTTTPYISHNLALGSLPGARAEEEAASPGTILLYGVNAAGKSSLGKAIGLAVLMAQAGMPVPATAMTLIPYTAVFTRILGNDNLWAGMSSFVVEMTEFRSILRSAGPRTLVIGDELCAGTETASATAIVAAGLQTLSARGTHSFFATHLHELATIPELAVNAAIRAYHLTVHPDLTTGHLVYDRKLREGCGSPMYGLEVCRGLDMDADFLQLAFDLRKRMFEPTGAHLSSYNPDVVVRACEVCGASGAKGGLETHHIVPQAVASPSGKIAAGVHKNTAANLAVLCESCHRDHHAGLLEVQGWVATTVGRKLSVRRAPSARC